MSKKQNKSNGLEADGVMRSVRYLTQEVARQHLSNGMPHIECILMASSEEDKHSDERSALRLFITWERNQNEYQYMVTFMGAKGERYQALARIDDKEGFKVPLNVIETYLSGEFVDTRRRTTLERTRFNRLMAALQGIRDDEEIHLEESLAALATLSQRAAA